MRIQLGRYPAKNMGVLWNGWSLRGWLFAAWSVVRYVFEQHPGHQPGQPTG